jgi:hypothetical protein
VLTKGRWGVWRRGRPGLYLGLGLDEGLARTLSWFKSELQPTG